MKSRKIVILGSNGMLGQTVLKYFSKRDYEVEVFDNRFEYATRISYAEKIKSVRNSVVINCIGRIKQKTNDTNDLISANALLPAELRNNLKKDVVLIQPSTDCVFSGDYGKPYPVDHSPDAMDDYGWSKRLGEVVLEGRANTLVIRVSIIGPDKNVSGKGLMAWVKSNVPGNDVCGYTNHLWNGITTLEWCKQVEVFAKKNVPFDYSLLQFGTTEFHSKYEMLRYFNEIYNLQLTIKPTTTDIPIDRRLIPNIESSGLFQQLLELKSFERE